MALHLQFARQWLIFLIDRKHSWLSPGSSGQGTVDEAAFNSVGNSRSVSVLDEELEFIHVGYSDNVLIGDRNMANL